MAVNEEDIIRDTNERDNLQRAVADLETAIAASGPGTRRMLELSLAGVKAKVSTLDKKIEDAKVERAVEVQAQAAAAVALAARETALNASERETYKGFLEESYFTKNDFGKLGQFYTHSYDRLSEGGKEEMSHRVWEGIRHDEYRFTDLPSEVREKEAGRVYAKLTDPSRERDSLEQIPEMDREDFVRAYKAGDRKQTGEVLNRESFRRNVATDASRGVKHQTATAGKSADDHGVLADDEPKDIVPGGSSAMVKLKSAAEKLKDLKLDDSPPNPLAAAIPGAGASPINARSPA